MCIRRAVLRALAGPCLAAATPLVALATPPAPQAPVPSALEGWDFTAQGGAGLSFYFGEQAADPAIGFAAGRFLSDTLQFETQLLAVPGAERVATFESFRDGVLVGTHTSREQREMYAVLTRINLHLGHGNTRPYLTFGTGLGWGRETDEQVTRCLVGDCPTGPEFRHDFSDQGLALVTLLGTGVDIGLAGRWRLRPELIMPLMWGAPQPGFVTLTVGITYTTRPSGSARRDALSLPRPAAGEPLSSAWRRVGALPHDGVIRVHVRRGTGTAALRDGQPADADTRTLVGTFVAADGNALELRIPSGRLAGTWRIPRTRVERIERGRLERNGPWEGILGGFVVGGGIGAFAYLSSGGGDDHQIWIPAGTLLFGVPAAFIGGLTDTLHDTFEPTELVYDLRLVMPGS